MQKCILRALGIRTPHFARLRGKDGYRDTVSPKQKLHVTISPDNVQLSHSFCLVTKTCYICITLLYFVQTQPTPISLGCQYANCLGTI